MEILEVRYGEIERPFLYPCGVSVIAFIIFFLVAGIAALLGDEAGANLLGCLGLLSIISYLIFGILDDLCSRWVEYKLDSKKNKINKVYGIRQDSEDE